MEYLLDLSSKEPKRMFLLQCVCKVDGSTGHYVGLINGTIYDNDAATGGKFEAKDYAEKFLSGVRKAAEIIPRPVSKKKNKNKSRKQRKRELAQQQEKDDAFADNARRLIKLPKFTMAEFRDMLQDSLDKQEAGMT